MAWVPCLFYFLRFTRFCILINAHPVCPFVKCIDVLIFLICGFIVFLTGKILTDSVSLKDYNIQESNFVVVMVSRAKVVSKPTEVGGVNVQELSHKMTLPPSLSSSSSLISFLVLSLVFLFSWSYLSLISLSSFSQGSSSSASAPQQEQQPAPPAPAPPAPSPREEQQARSDEDSQATPSDATDSSAPTSSRWEWYLGGTGRRGVGLSSGCALLSTGQCAGVYLVSPPPAVLVPSRVHEVFSDRSGIFECADNGHV